MPGESSRSDLEWISLLDTDRTRFTQEFSRKEQVDTPTECLSDIDTAIESSCVYFDWDRLPFFTLPTSIEQFLLSTNFAGRRIPKFVDRGYVDPDPSRAFRMRLTILPPNHPQRGALEHKSTGCGRLLRADP